MVKTSGIGVWRLRQTLRRAWAHLPSASQRVYVEPYTMLTAKRLLNLERAVRCVVSRQIPGDVVECGTAQGGSAALLALWLQKLGSKKLVYVFDTFEGLPAPTAADPDFEVARQLTGKCRGELQDVHALFDQLGVLDRAVFVKGLFEDTLPTVELQEISLLHLDGDWYQSTKTCFDHLWEHVSPGGVVQIDDYGAWQGCRKAVDEFFEAHSVSEPLRMIDDTGGWLEKRATRVQLQARS